MAAGRASYALVHSPLVGRGCWRGVERALRREGVAARATDYGGVRGPDWYAGAAARIARQIEDFDGAWVLALHSGAGALAPSVVDTAATPPVAVVFVDAILPHPGRSWLETATPALAERLRGLAENGLAPPWNCWFEPDPTVALIDDRDVRAEFLDELPRLPLCFLETPAPTLDLAVEVKAAHLRLSGAYAAEAAEARRRGWTVAAASMHHLAVVTHPDRVGRILTDLAEGLLADG